REHVLLVLSPEDGQILGQIKPFQGLSDEELEIAVIKPGCFYPNIKKIMLEMGYSQELAEKMSNYEKEIQIIRYDKSDGGRIMGAHSIAKGEFVTITRSGMIRTWSQKDDGTILPFGTPKAI